MQSKEQWVQSIENNFMVTLKNIMLLKECTFNKGKFGTAAACSDGTVFSEAKLI